MKTEAFIKVWQRAESVAEVVAETGTTESAARSRASSLRKLGIPLKKFGKGRPPMDKERMKAVARKNAR